MVEIDDLWFLLFDSEEKIAAFAFGISVVLFIYFFVCFCRIVVELISALVHRYIYPGKQLPAADQEDK